VVPGELQRGALAQVRTPLVGFGKPLAPLPRERRRRAPHRRAGRPARDRAPEDIVLEVTESLATTQLTPVLGNIVRLRMKGLRIAIDDYGTGLSSLQQRSRACRSPS
jgi:hypothetical protein